MRIRTPQPRRKRPRRPPYRESSWKCTTRFYEHQDALEDNHLAQYAKLLGLDAARLMSELLAGVHTARVREDFRSGARGGVNGTPAFFINGQRYDGDLNLDELLDTLEP